MPPSPAPHLLSVPVDVRRARTRILLVGGMGISHHGKRIGGMLVGIG
jgi:hypothetical protein